MSDLVVMTRYGKVEGVKEEGVCTWKGVPYAQPPTGALRFRPPQQLEKWEGVKETKEFSAVAMQPTREIMSFLSDRPTNMNEDCLYLNIWSPRADQKRRPVLVWIHGGAFLNGSGASPSYDGTSFATQGDVVVVTINYRLGVFGFLHLGEFGDEQFATSGNCGLLDQIAALKWVQDNIEAFGGDPENVTIFGESAGAMSVGCLLVMPEAKGLYSKAILQSGAARNVLDSSEATKVSTSILSNLQIETDALENLQDIPSEKIMAAAEHIKSMQLGPVLDGVSIPKFPHELLAEGAAKNIPILIGTTEDEYRLFTIFDPTWENIPEVRLKRRFERALRPVWSDIQAQFSDEQLNQTLFEQLMTFHTFTYPAIELSEQQVQHDSPVWMYRFDWKSTALNGELKSCHALEIPFVFNNVHKPETETFTGNSPDRFPLAKQMHQAWINFARNGNPNSDELPDWPQYDLETRATMHFNTSITVTRDPESEKRKMWKKAYANVNV